jgi:hypothetical protein
MLSVLYVGFRCKREKGIIIYARVNQNAEITILMHRPHIPGGQTLVILFA